ncbi:putative protein kinase [Trypanosoma rangeli]|uniref:Protein kinase domain-containing protein n=1 Tax=Trypanosoma rangeli TaxID=5698 RepID=A0A422P3F8_TRYRA|nr:putative protein kinase [Trypanosoma rangeli]RNF12195.1 putative protein kinase [Trypanosoma rangeli]|eukprot:RNF12195.1 putative protein kinase [Trypanosoma rangeli]
MLSGDSFEEHRLQHTTNRGRPQSSSPVAGSIDRGCAAAAASSEKFDQPEGRSQSGMESMSRRVVDCRSLSMEDISLMRLRGCRTMASTTSSLVIPEEQRQQPHRDHFSLTGHMLMSLRRSASPKIPETLAAQHHESQGTNSDVLQSIRCESGDSSTGGLVPRCMTHDSDENGDEVISVVYDSLGIKFPDVGSDAFQGVTSERLFSFCLEKSGNLGANVSSFQRKCLVPASNSPYPSVSSSYVNVMPGNHPFSTRRFPVLGRVDAGSYSVFHPTGLRGAGEEEVKESGGGNEGERWERGSDDGGDGEMAEEFRINANETVMATFTAASKEDEADVDSAIAVEGKGGGAFAGEELDRKGHDNDDCNSVSCCFLDWRQRRQYLKRLRCVYAFHERIAAAAEDEVDPVFSRNSSQSAGRLVPPHAELCSLFLLKMTGTPPGYYSFGSWRSMQHPNKKVVPAMSTLLSSFSTYSCDSRQSSLSFSMDPHILFLIERRPLLQTTLFAEFTYRKIYQKMRQQQQQVPKSSASGYVNNPTWAPFVFEGIPNKEESSEKESNRVADVTIASVEIDSPKGPAAVDSVTDSSLTAGEFVELAPKPVVSSTSFLGAGESPVTVYRRPLTQLHSCKRKVHTIDGNTRCVDNEEDDLVVYVGMIIMGWLEVVDLLGAGTFGQVFLCKDLRISDGHFVHPGEIEGEDFQYWQCSHEYIPFSDPSLMPTHSPLVAVKVVKSRELFEQQSILEAEMLVYIGTQIAPKQTRDAEVSEGIAGSPSAMEPPELDAPCQYVAHIFAHGICYGHHCIVMERYGANLFEYVQSRDFKGLPMYHIQAIGRKMLLALTLLHEECHVVHGDIKPENVLLTLDSCFSTPTVHRTTAANTGGGCVGHDDGVSRGSRVTSKSSSVLLCPSARVSFKHKLTGASTSNTMESSLPAPVPFRTRHYGYVGKNQCTPHDMESLGEGEGSVEDAAQGTQNVTLPSLKIRLIDFSSSFYVGASIYTYVQSRYYRAPEVIVGAGYGPPIDIWSTGCLLAELLLGLPLLPGSSDFHQLYLIEEMLGPLPSELLGRGKQTTDYYLVEPTESEGGISVSGGSTNTGGSVAESVSSFRLFREDEYRARHENAPPVEWRCYFQYRTLAELLRNCMLSVEEKQIALRGLSVLAVGEPTEDMPPAAAEQQRPIKAIIDEMMQQRFWLYDLLKKMLHGDPSRRPTAREALFHPFFMHTPNYMKPYLFVTE